MKIEKISIINILIPLAILPVLFLFNNCGNLNKEALSSGSLGSQNYFQSTATPENFCGEPGFEFLMDNYFSEYCTDCHTVGGLSIVTIDNKDMEGSFYSLGTFGKEIVMETVTENRFCGDTCNLTPGSEVYNAVNDWLDCPF
ncbi:MAG: hypothetical protein HOO06_02560 [Bdellovibrionaceae bacterium]|jgi:hypothetical protein|nr:hypothetical protein [Pseudobdellovibrionaceae bacterium]